MPGVRTLALLLLALASGGRVQGQLLAGVKQFFGTLPTFYSVDKSPAPKPGAPGVSGAPDVNLLVVATNATALMDSLLSVPVNSTTHEWEVTDPSLGAGVKLGPSGATLLTRDPTKGQDAYEQSLRIGPDGVVVGPNNASARVNRTADLAQGTLGVSNVHLGPSGVLINNGSPLNSSVKVTGDGLLIQGNPTGSGQSHFYVKPNLRIGDQQVLGQAVNGSLNNVQISLGDTNKTAGEQMSDFHSYELHANGSVSAASNATLANPYFATNSAGQASMWGPAAAPARSPPAVPMAVAPSASMLAARVGSLPRRFGSTGDRGTGSALAGAVQDERASSQQNELPQEQHPTVSAAAQVVTRQAAAGQSSGEILPAPAAALPAGPVKGAHQVQGDAGSSASVQAQRQGDPSAAPDMQAMVTGDSTALKNSAGIRGTMQAATKLGAGSTAQGAEGSAQQWTTGPSGNGGGRRMLRSWLRQERDRHS